MYSRSVSQIEHNVYLISAFIYVLYVEINIASRLFTSLAHSIFRGELYTPIHPKENISEIYQMSPIN